MTIDTLFLTILLHWFRSLPELSLIVKTSIRGFTYSPPKLKSFSDSQICCSSRGDLVLVWLYLSLGYQVSNTYEIKLTQGKYTGEWWPGNFCFLIVGPEEHFQVYIVKEWNWESCYQSPAVQILIPGYNK